MIAVKTITTCAIIPVFNHAKPLVGVLQRVREQGLFCILVDDGSDESCAIALAHIQTSDDRNIALVRHSENRGKGAAILTAMGAAAQRGFSHALQIDADGQHQTDDIPKMLALAQSQPDAVILGCPQYDQSVPKARFYGRYLTHVWVWINTLSFAIKDSMCGFRVYPIAPVLQLAQQVRIGKRMEFDSEVLVRLSWQGMRFVNMPTAVKYPPDGVSHFRAFRDNALISKMHAKLFFAMLLRLPQLVWRRWSVR